jgi:hypothetical protein
MNLSEVSEIVVADFIGPASSQIIWQPVAVTGQDQMRRESHSAEVDGFFPGHIAEHSCAAMAQATSIPACAIAGQLK